MSEQSVPKEQNKMVTEELYHGDRANGKLIPASEPFKIYLLKRIFVAGPDEFDGKVIIASSAKAARKIANLKTGDEGKIWTDSNLVMCKEINLNDTLVVLESFKAG